MQRRALADRTPPAIAALYEEAAAQIAQSLAEHAVARPAVRTGEHYTETSLVYFIEVNRVLTGEQDAASAVARIGDQVRTWLE